MKSEIWIDVPNYKGYYQVSNFGRVRSMDRIVTNKKGFSKLIYGKVLKPGKEVNGYVHVIFCKDCMKNQQMVHRVVIEAFMGYENLDVNHKDLRKDNNTLDNLEYCNRRDNMIHCFNARNTSSNFNGVSFFKKTQSWEVNVMVERVNYFLGRYKTEIEAAQVQSEYLIKLTSVSKDQRKQIVSELMDLRKKTRLQSV